MHNHSNHDDHDASRKKTRPRLGGAPQPQGTASFFPDVPPELTPRSLDPAKLSDQESDNAQQALDLLQQKMASITVEFADGKVNQAQFQAVYARYCEQKAIIERIQSRDPDSKAWQAILADGYTGSLRKQYAAHVLGLVIIEMQSALTLRTLGDFDLTEEMMLPILSSLLAGQVTAFEAGVRSTQIEGGRWLAFVPGEYSASVAIFSHEPSSDQLKMVTNLHRDFERANRQQLVRGQANPRRLVYPQRVMFEEADADLRD